MKKILVVACLLGSWLVAGAQNETVLSGEQLFGAIRARQIGPALMSGRITDLEGHPANNRILYVGRSGKPRQGDLGRHRRDMDAQQHLCR